MKFVQALIVGAVSSLMVVSTASAAINLFPPSVCHGQNGETVVCQQKAQASSKLGSNPIISALRITIEIISFVVGVSAVITLIVGGLNMVTAAGDAQAFNRARNLIIYALVGLVLVGLAQVIVAFVLKNV